MKKFLVTLVFFICALTLHAQTNAGYFTESTKPFGINKPPVGFQSEKSYIYGTTAATLAGTATDNIYSRPFGTSATGVRNSFMGKKLLVGINISVAFGIVAATVTAEISGDGTNWMTQSTLDADATPNVTGVQWYLLDLTSTYAPYIRLKFNGNGLIIGTSGKIAFLYAIPQ